MQSELSARIARLEQLYLGLAREALRVSKGGLRLHFDERREYLAALHEAIAGVESARVVLARACRRVEK
jgi:hypothetical protein